MWKVHALGVNRFMTYQLQGFLAEPTMCGKRLRWFRLLVFLQEWLAHKNHTMDELLPHTGNLIKAELRKQGRTIDWLAFKMGYTCLFMSKILEISWLDYDFLRKVSDIMDHDFFKDCEDSWASGGRVSRA